MKPLSAVTEMNSVEVQLAGDPCMLNGLHLLLFFNAAIHSNSMVDNST